MLFSSEIPELPPGVITSRINNNDLAPIIGLGSYSLARIITETHTKEWLYYQQNYTTFMRYHFLSSLNIK